MNRKDFIINTFKSTAFICASCYLSACKDDSIPTGSGNEKIDFTIDLTQSKYSALNSIGGTVYEKGVIICRISSTEFIAFSQFCTHQGTTVQLQLNQNRFFCPNHGSTFSISNGSVINGPVNSPLKKYNITQDGNTLRIFE